MLEALVWLLTLTLLGWLFFPLAYALFSRLPDRGFTLTRPLVLVVGGYILWLGGVAQIFPYHWLVLLALLALGLGGSWLAWRRREAEILDFIHREKNGLLVFEALFVAFFAFWLVVVAEAPAINHTEKPMDFAFLNAILQSRFFPPEDPWLAGHPISYYYFGHFMLAALVKLTATASNIGYNLALITIPALAAPAIGGLVHNLTRMAGANRAAALRFAVAGAILLLAVGNLSGVLEFARLQGWGNPGFWQWLGIKGITDAAPGGDGLFPTQYWWWWKTTRVIDTLAPGGGSLDYTITEYPLFSYLLGDLHPHATSVPFVLLSLGLLLNLFMSTTPIGPVWLRRHWPEAAVITLCLGALAFGNAWDFPLIGGLLALVALSKSFAYHQGRPGRAFLHAALFAAPIGAAAILLYLPYYQDLSSQAQGVRLVGDVHTRPIHFFLVLGLPAFLGIAFLLRQLPGVPRPQRRDAPLVLFVAAVALAPFLAWAALQLAGALAAPALPPLLQKPLAWALGSVDTAMAPTLLRVASRLLWALPGLAVAAAAGYCAVQRLRQGRDPVTAFPLLLLALAAYLLVGVELFHVVDFFGNRMNTIFKVYYQAWILLAAVGAYSVYVWQRRAPASAAEPAAPAPTSRKVRESLAAKAAYGVWALATAALLLASFYLSVGAVLERTGWLSGSHQLSDNTLDGLAYVKRGDSGEYAAIAWLRDEAPHGVLVEAVGGDYSEFGRVAASTGLPGVLNWAGHEYQWRGNTRVYAGREPDVARIYQTDDSAELLRLLDKYNVRYVYLGSRERREYGTDHLAKFDAALTAVFKQGGATIYERVR